MFFYTSIVEMSFVVLYFWCEKNRTSFWFIKKALSMQALRVTWTYNWYLQFSQCGEWNKQTRTMKNPWKITLRWKMFRRHVYRKIKRKFELPVSKLWFQVFLLLLYFTSKGYFPLSIAVYVFCASAHDTLLFHACTAKWK